MNRTLLGPTLAALVLVQCGGAVPLTAPAGATLTMEANPKSIPVIGGRSTITVIGFKSEADGGGTLPDGTQIFFTTDLGVIEERVAMENGIARATLQSDGRAGTATVSANSGGIAPNPNPVTVQIGAGPEGDVILTVTANPATLGPTDFTSEIVVTATDNRGNVLADLPVIFSTTQGALASQGSVLRTNVNGQAFDRLTLLADQGDATVTVTSGSATGSVNVTRGDFADPVIDSVFPASGTRGATLTVTITGQKFQPGATVSFGDGIGINDVTFVNSETLLADITIAASALSGSRTVRVTNPDGNDGELAGAFTVGGSAPVCRMSVQPVTAGSGTSSDPWIMSSSLVAFNGTASFDPDGGPITFNWDVGDPPTPPFTTGSFSYNFSAPGRCVTAPPPPEPCYQVVLTVTDEDDETCSLTRFLDVP